MGKKIGLKQLVQKKYNEVPGLSERMKASLGEIEDAFDAITWGDSAEGKTNFNIQVMSELVTALNCKAVYVTWEEGHGKTIRDLVIRHNLMEKLGNRLQIMDGGNFDEVYKIMNRRKSAKVWVFDSVQASDFTIEQIYKLKKEFVLSRKKKILLWISWADGKLPLGATARAIKFYANLKIRVEKFIAFVRGRYGGNKNYVIWSEGAIKYWGLKMYHRHQNR